MAQNAADIRIAIKGRVLTAPPGSTAPVEVADAWAAAWIDHGFTDQSGVTLSPKIATMAVKAWQSDKPVRTRVTERADDIKFILLQSGGLNTELYFGGGSFAAVPAHAGVSQYTPPVPGVDDQRMLGIEFVDGIIIKRFVYPQVIVTAVDPLPLNAQKEASYGVTLSVETDTWFILSNDPADQSGALAA